MTPKHTRLKSEETVEPKTLLQNEIVEKAKPVYTTECSTNQNKRKQDKQSPETDSDFDSDFDSELWHTPGFKKQRRSTYGTLEVKLFACVFDLIF